MFIGFYEMDPNAGIRGDLPEDPQDHVHGREPNVAEAAKSWSKKMIGAMF